MSSSDVRNGHQDQSNLAARAQWLRRLLTWPRRSRPAVPHSPRAHALKKHARCPVCAGFGRVPAGGNLWRVLRTCVPCRGHGTLTLTIEAQR